MAFPLPADAEFRRVCVQYWLDDVDDRLAADRLDDAEFSWKEANAIYLSLPPGCGDMELEDRLFQCRVKLSKLLEQTYENHLRGHGPSNTENQDEADA
jgi:hypothetical protein